MHTATVLEPGDELWVGFMHPNGKYVEVRVMAGHDVFQVESRDESIEVIGSHQCPASRI